MAAGRHDALAQRRLVLWLGLDVASVALLFVLGLSEMRVAGDDIFFRSADGIGIALLALATLPAAARRVVPVVATSLCTLGQAAVLFAGYAPTNAVLASHRTEERSWRRLMPTARNSPSSRVRSWIDRPRVFTMPIRAITIARPSRA